MFVRRKGTDLQLLHSAAAVNRCRVVTGKDRGVRRLAERGEHRPDGPQRLVADTVGCNPRVDAFNDWWELGRAEFGGNDFRELFDPHEGVFALHPQRRWRPRGVPHGYAIVAAGRCVDAERHLIVPYLQPPLRGCLTS